MNEPTHVWANEVNGPVYGTVVQAGQSEGVHIHPPAVRPVRSLPYRAGAVPPRAAGFQARTSLPGKDSTARTCVVFGLGGVGKTQLAADHAERLWSAGAVELLVWVTAGSRGAIVSGYAELFTDLTGITESDPERGAQRLREYLAMLQAPWLVVLDDVSNPADLRKLWPPDTPAGRTVVTTRRQDAALRGVGRTFVEVGAFTPDEALAYLDSALTGHSHLRTGAADLAAALHCLPLALAQAATYLLDRGLSCAEYLERWTDRRLDRLFPEADGLPDEHRTTVAVTWSLSVEQANRLEPAGVARPLLEVAGFLDPNDIPAGLFAASAVVRLVSVAAGRAVSAAEVRDGLGCLRRLSLITLDGATRAVRVHALVQRATLDAVPAGHRRALARAAADALTEVWPPAHQNPALAELFRANAAALAQSGGEHLWAPDVHPVLVRVGDSLGDAGLVAEARTYFHRLNGTAMRRLSPDHPGTLAIRGQLAYWRAQCGEVAGAVAAFTRLLADRRRVLGPDHPDTLTTRNNLVHWRAESGDVVGAVAAFEELLVDRLRLAGPDDPETFAVRGNIARWQAESGDVAGALAACEALLADLIRVLGPDGPGTLITRGNLAELRGRTGDVAGAVAAFQELLADRSRVLGAEHPQTLVTRGNLANWRAESGDTTGAVAELEELLADQLRVLGPDHPHTLITRNNLAEWRGRAGDLAGAVAAFGKLLTDRRRVLGRDHPKTQATADSLTYWRKRRSRRE